MSIFNENEWFATALGRHVLEREQAYFDEVVADIFGFNALQLGLTEFDLLRTSRIPLRAALGRAQAARVVGDPAFLPIASQSVDLLLLPHVLEFASNPHQILREVERVLIPEGHLLISGFNPFSVWGLKQFLNKRSGIYPWTGKFISLPRMKDWLSLLNFEVSGGRMCCYTPPFAGAQWRRRFAFMESAGDRWWPLGGGVYFLLARKRVHGMRLLTPNWHDALAAKRRLAAAAQDRVVQLHRKKQREPIV
jgi:SAM-dependent methyltransferase